MTTEPAVGVPAIVPAHDMDVVRELFREYQAFLGVDLCFQDFERELASLPGSYAPPAGAIVLATANDAVAGCVGLRPLPNGACEMKRMYVRPAFRGSGLGRALAEAVVAAAVDAGYRSMRLDTLDTLHAAIDLYRSMGFVPIEPYYHNPLPGVLYLEKALPGADRT